MADHGDWMFFEGGYMWLFWILLIVAIIALFKFITDTGSNSLSKPDESPMSILKKRYAKGEIDEEEFKRRKQELEKS